MSKLRWYQEEAIASVFNYFIQGNTGNPCIALPTGTGKSHVISGFMQKAFEMFPGQRFMMLTHVKELIEQNAAKLVAQWPNAPLGIYSAGLKQKDTVMPIVFGGVASVANNVAAFGRRDLVLVDECHLISPNDKTMYQKVLSELKLVNPYLKVIGLTATAYRLGQGMITDEGIFTDICYDMTSYENFNRLLAEGFLCPLVPRPTKTQFNIDNVGISGGEFKQGQLEAAVDVDNQTIAALTEICAAGQDRHAWLIFASGVKHADSVERILKSFGVPCAAVHSKRDSDTNDKNIKAFKKGELRCLINYGKLTTGFDYPAIDLIGVLRWTLSPGLWVQMLGRGTRPVYAYGHNLDTIEGRLTAIAMSQKKNCMVLDFANNTRRLGPINDPKIPQRKGKGGGGEAPVKICPACGTYNHASVRFCTFCNEEFDFNVKIVEQASELEVIRSDIPVIETFEITKTFYSKHTTGKGNSMRVTYFCDMQRFDEYIFFEADHKSLPNKKARDWWKSRFVPTLYQDGVNPGWLSIEPTNVPTTVDIALTLTNRLKEPKRIRVWVNKVHPEILSYEYGQETTAA